MPYVAPPTKIEISATPSPSNSVAKAGFGKLADWLAGLFGTTGKPAEAFAAMKLLDPRAIYNLKPIFSVNTNVLTIMVKDKDAVDLSVDNPGFVTQRSATLGDGGFSQRKLEANISLVVSAGSTLGHTANFLHPVYIYLIDNAGAQELAVAGTFQGESGIFTTTAEGGAGAADDLNVMYSTNARASVPGRLIAIAWFNQAIAGNWVNLPSEVKQQPFHLERVGVTEDYKGGVVPYGFYLENGANVSRTVDAKLFAKIGTAWGVGDGSTTFALPDSRRKTSVGSGGTGTGTLGNAIGNVGGAETHTLVIAEEPSHTHVQNAHTHTQDAHSHTQRVGADGGGATTGPDNSDTINENGGSTLTTVATNQNTTATNQNTGGNGAHNNLQPSMVVTKMIRWLGDI